MLVTILPCQTWHNRGLAGGADSCDPRDQHLSEKPFFTLPTPRSPTQAISYYLSRLGTLLLRERELYLMTFVAARRVRMDMRRKACVGASGGQPESSAEDGRSLDGVQPYGC
jgi:hypothetical protein